MANIKEIATEIVFRCVHGGERADFDRRLPQRLDWQALIKQAIELILSRQI